MFRGIETWSGQTILITVLNLNDQGIWGTFPLLFTTIWGWPEPGDPVGPVWSAWNLPRSQAAGGGATCRASAKFQMFVDTKNLAEKHMKTWNDLPKQPSLIPSSFQPFLQKKNETPKNLITSSAVWHFLKRGGEVGIHIFGGDFPY